MNIGIIEIAHLSVSLIEVAQSTEEPNMLGANWEGVRTDNVRYYGIQVRGTKPYKIVDLLPPSERSDDHVALRVVSSKQRLESSKSVLNVDHSPMHDTLSYHLLDFYPVLRPSQND